MSSADQKDKNRQQFIDAAKELLLTEGVENVSVRKVGNRCGCSYATIYNYFDNLDHLLWAVATQILRDMIRMYDPYLSKKSYRAQELAQILREYVSYYLRNPNVFSFFFYYRPESDPRVEAKQQSEVEEQTMMRERPHLEAVIQNVLRNLEDKSIFETVSVDATSSVLVHSIHGLLMMYFSQRRQMTEEDLFQQLDQIIEFVIKSK